MPRKNVTLERLDKFEERLSRIEEVVRSLPEASQNSFVWARVFRQLAFVYGLPHSIRSGQERLTETGELAVDPWKHLVGRPHPWRKQLYLRGRNMTARQLVGGMRANSLD